MYWALAEFESLHEGPGELNAGEQSTDPLRTAMESKREVNSAEKNIMDKFQKGPTL